MNNTDPPGYVIHPNCPFDYCWPPTENFSMNLNLPDGSDAQCAFKRTGILCGTCQEHFSLSLGTSQQSLNFFPASFHPQFPILNPLYYFQIEHSDLFSY